MELRAIIEQLVPIAVGLGSFFITYLIIPAIIRVSHLKHLFDAPDNGRKLHIGATPNLGGVAIYASILITFTVSGYALLDWAPYLAAGLTILFFSGIKDDILVISAWKKLSLQCIAIALLIVGGNLVITDVGGVFGFNEIPLWAGMALTFFTMVVVLNAYNLIDGIDGLAGGIGVISSLFFGAWFWHAGMTGHAALAFTLTGSLLAFLRFNFQPASIFMGDTGSQVVGYVLALLAVAFVQEGVASADPVPFQEVVPVLVLSVLIVPLYDTLRVFMVRVAKGRSPFSPDRLHVHHQLLDAGLSHKASCFVIYGFNLLVIGLTLLLSAYIENINLLFASVLLTAMVVFPTVNLKRRLLKKMGFRMPSARQIYHLEKKYNVAPRSPRKVSRPSKSKKRKYKEVAV